MEYAIYTERSEHFYLSPPLGEQSMRSRMPDSWSDANCRELFHRAMKLADKGDESALMLTTKLGRAALYGRYDEMRTYIRHHVVDVYHIWTV